MDISGKVIQVLPKQTGNGKNGVWEKQEYVIEIEGTYPKKVCFNLWSPKIAQFDIKEGEFLNVSVDIESREYNGRWYTDVKAWKVERPGAANSAPSQASSSTPAAANVADPFASSDANSVADPFAADSDSADDLPF